MRLYYDREKAMEDPEKFETLCDMFCYESNFDLCDVNSLGDSFQIYCSFLLKISLVNLGSFGVDKAEISLFLNLKAIKAKKATIVA